jgi:hypothetical protein
MAQHLQREQQAREQIDKMLDAAGWVLQDFDELNLSYPGVAAREVEMKRGHARPTATSPATSSTVRRKKHLRYDACVGSSSSTV